MDIQSTTSKTPDQAMHIMPTKLKNHPVIQKIGIDFDDAFINTYRSKLASGA